MAEKEYKKEMVSDPDLLPDLEDYILNIAEENKFPEERYNDLALSVAEAASNGMLHGNKLDKSKKIFISVNVSPTKMIIKIKDEGEGFNPATVPDPTAPENILKESGRGLHIMRTYLDSLEYNFADGSTEVILTFLYKNK